MLTTFTENDWLLLTACDFKQHFVIEAQSELRHSRQDHFELNGTNNFTPQDAAVGAHLRVNEEQLILHESAQFITFKCGFKQSNLQMFHMKCQSECADKLDCKTKQP